MEHTPTPWAKEKTHFAYPPTWMILLNNADYQRAKICVNACSEFPDPKIDIGLLKLHAEQQTKLLASCEAALAERDVTIQALQSRVKELEGELKDRLRYIDDTY